MALKSSLRVSFRLHTSEVNGVNSDCQILDHCKYVSETKSILNRSKRKKSILPEENLSVSVNIDPIDQVQISTYLGVVLVVDDKFNSGHILKIGYQN